MCASSSANHRFDLGSYLADRVTRVNKFLDEQLSHTSEHSATLSQAMRYSLFAGGKRLRPVLVLASAEAVGGTAEPTLPSAAAFELIHTYSLIHDDLPAMDDDSLRRGKPTSHVVYGEAIAILTGDALQTLAFELMSQPAVSDGMNAKTQLRAIACLAEASGFAGMAAGQVIDLESEGLPVEPRTLEKIHRLKTGALIRASCEVGAIVGGGTKEHIERLRVFGTEIGLAFQIVDDILDVEEDAATLGKSAGKDAQAGKATYPDVHGMGRAKQHVSDAYRRALASLEPFGDSALPLRALAERIVERRS